MVQSISQSLSKKKKKKRLNNASSANRGLAVGEVDAPDPANCRAWIPGKPCIIGPPPPQKKKINK